MNDVAVDSHAPTSAQTPALGRNHKPIPTQCIHGHELTPENTRIRPDGARACIACANARWQAWRDRQPQTIGDIPHLDGDGLIDILAAIVRQAISDFRAHRNDRPHMPAAAFLEACGLLDAEGRLDRHGYTLASRAHDPS